MTTFVIPAQWRPDFVTLAAKKINTKLLALLGPHKIALLAIERQAEKILREEIGKATTTLQMFRTTKKHLKAVYTVSSKLAYAHAVKEFEMLGLEPPPMPKLSNAYLNQLNLDLRQALKDDTLSAVQKAQRAGLSAVSAANRAYTDMQLEMYASVGELTGKNAGKVVEKVWTTNKNAGTPPCNNCTALDGTVVSIEEEFPLPAGVKKYRDLLGPPLHPNCRCRLVPRLGVVSNA